MNSLTEERKSTPRERVIVRKEANGLSFTFTDPNPDTRYLPDEATSLFARFIESLILGANITFRGVRPHK